MILNGSKPIKTRKIMKKTLYLAVSTALVLAACTKEQAPVNTEKQNENLTTIYATIDNVKSTVDANAIFSWASGEAISVGTASGYANFTCSNTETGAFTGSGAPLNVAVSPAQSGTFTSETEFQVTLTANYTYAEGVTNALMVGTSLGENKYQFSHAAALIAVTYENLPAGTTGLQITADKNITGSVTLTGTSTSAIQIQNTKESLNGKTVTVTHDATEGNTDSRTYYVPVPTGTYASLSVQLLNSNDALAASTVKTVKNVTLAQGDVLPFPAITLAKNFVPYTLGATDNSNGWESVWDNPYTISKGEVLHMEFVNHSDKTDNAHNWILLVTNNKPFIKDATQRAESGYSEYFVLRADNWGWGANYSANRLSSNYNWSTFRDDMDGATVSMTIEYTNLGSIIVKTKTSTNKYETYSHPVSLSDGAIGAFLWCNNSYYEIKKVWYSASKKTSITSIKGAYTYYLHEEDLDLDTIGWPKDVIATYNDGEDAAILTSAITFPTGKTLEATAGNHEYSVTYNNSPYMFAIPVALGTSHFGSKNFENGWWQTFSSDTFTKISTPSVSRTFFLYSLGTDNYNGPLVVLANGSDPTSATENAVLEMTHNGWGVGFTNNDDQKSSNWNWDVFAEYLKFATITVTISHANNVATVRYDVTYRNGESHFQEYTGITVDSENFYYRFMVRESYAVFKP